MRIHQLRCNVRHFHASSNVVTLSRRELTLDRMRRLILAQQTACK